MITVRPSAERGHASRGWLESYHTFSFADYHDPEQMGFRALRVINEDWIEAGRGFGTHPHRDMEILTYVVQGALEHRDSMGNGSVIRPGDVQAMSAGTGVAHSEFNHSTEETVHLLQIWILPERPGLEPGYQERLFSDAEKQGRLRLIASRDGREGSAVLHQDVSLYASLLAAGDTVRQSLAEGRHAWLQVIRGEVTLNGTPLRAGDGAAVTGETALEIRAADDSELLLFDLA